MAFATQQQNNVTVLQDVEWQQLVVSPPNLSVTYSLGDALL